MTDNARIVREALDTGGHAHRCGVEWAYACDCGAGKTIDAGYMALTALETELATAKADLERAREEELERIVGILTDPHNQITWKCPSGSSVHADPRFIRAALAPEQKDPKPPIFCDRGTMINQNLPESLGIGWHVDHTLPPGTIEVWRNGKRIGRIENIGQPAPEQKG